LTEKKYFSEIAKKLQVSRATVTRDIKKIRNENSNWINDMASKLSIITELKLTYERLLTSINHLTMLREEAKTVSEKIQLEKALVDFNKNLYDLQTHFPLAKSFNNFIQEHVINNPAPNKRRLPVLTPELEEYYEKQEKRREEELKLHLASKGIEYHPLG